MWSDTREGRQFLEDVSRNVIAEVAVEELELFPELAQDHFAAPPPAENKNTKDDALGFGIETVTVFTPIVLGMATAVVHYVADQVTQAAKEEAPALIKAKIKAVFEYILDGEKHGTQTKPAPLSREQLVQVKKLAVKNATAQGIKPADAEKLALCLIGSLAAAK